MEPVTVPIGGIATRYHAVNLKMRTIVDNFDERDRPSPRGRSFFPAENSDDETAVPARSQSGSGGVPRVRDPLAVRHFPPVR